MATMVQATLVPATPSIRLIRLVVAVRIYQPNLHMEPTVPGPVAIHMHRATKPM